jgi:hypothetical protein
MVRSILVGLLLATHVVNEDRDATGYNHRAYQYPSADELKEIA